MHAPHPCVFTTIHINSHSLMTVPAIWQLRMKSTTANITPGTPPPLVTRSARRRGEHHEASSGLLGRDGPPEEPPRRHEIPVAAHATHSPGVASCQIDPEEDGEGAGILPRTSSRPGDQHLAWTRILSRCPRSAPSCWLSLQEVLHGEPPGLPRMRERSSSAVPGMRFGASPSAG